jgi:hypothetical protein
MITSLQLFKPSRSISLNLLYVVVSLFSMFIGLFIEIMRGLKTLEILKKSELSLLVQVGNWKFNPSRKMIPNSSRFVVFYCGAILA